VASSRWPSSSSAGYTIAQYLGWTWGKFRRPAQAARFHLLMIVVLIVGSAVLLTGVDPIEVTEYSVVFSAIALPLTYLPILLVANDDNYLGKHVNGRATNVLATIYLVIIPERANDFVPKRRPRARASAMERPRRGRPPAPPRDRTHTWRPTCS
jgi:hypothetical protein